MTSPVKKKKKKAKPLEPTLVVDPSKLEAACERAAAAADDPDFKRILARMNRQINAAKAKHKAALGRIAADAATELSKNEEEEEEKGPEE